MAEGSMPTSGASAVMMSLSSSTFLWASFFASLTSPLKDTFCRSQGGGVFPPRSPALQQFHCRPSHLHIVVVGELVAEQVHFSSDGRPETGDRRPELTPVLPCRLLFGSCLLLLSPVSSPPSSLSCKPASQRGIVQKGYVSLGGKAGQLPASFEVSGLVNTKL